jgi:2,5-dihydroxypyridine 5,6-dioxygenase
MQKSLAELFTAQFALCKVERTQMVGVICEHGQKQEYVDASVMAARQHGAGVLVLTASSLSNPVLPPYASDGREIPALLAAAGECDFIVDVTVGGLIHSDVRTRITGRGKRMLFVAEPADVLARLAGDPTLRKAIELAAQKLKQGSTLTVESGSGTNLKVDISGAELPITKQWGYVDEPGRWDHWPSGFIACFPHDKTASGIIVLQPGDVLLPWQKRVRDHVTLEIEKGFIKTIEGEGTDAFVLRDYFSRWQDPNVYALSHMGWGMHPRASWSALEAYPAHTLYGQELRSVAGNFMWSTGSNRFANRETPAHLDIPMHGCTVKIDGEVVVAAGQLTAEPAARRRDVDALAQ